MKPSRELYLSFFSCSFHPAQYSVVSMVLVYSSNTRCSGFINKQTNNLNIKFFKDPTKLLGLQEINWAHTSVVKMGIRQPIKKERKSVDSQRTRSVLPR